MTGAYGNPVSLRNLFATIIALALLFAPAAMQSGAAMASSMPSNHHSQMMDKGHCGEKPEDRKSGMAGGELCCVAMCAAVAVASASTVKAFAFLPSVERPALEQPGHSFLAELATPPPRRA